MSVVIGCVSPHPPILVPEIGRESVDQIKSSEAAMKKMANVVAEANPQTLVFISPHSPVLSDSIAIKSKSNLSGSFGMFGVYSLQFEAKNNLELVDEIIKQANSLNVSIAKLSESKDIYGHSEVLDHGVLVPYYYLQPLLATVSIVSLSISFLTHLDHYKLGLAVQQAATVLDKRVAFIASGDLSHRLTRGAPAGYSPRGQDFDNLVKDLIEKGAFNELMSIDEVLTEEAGECGLRSIIALGGCFDGREVDSQVYSYEGPFGVGYLVAVVKPKEESNKRNFLSKLDKNRQANPEKRRKNESPPVRLARQSIESFITSGKIIALSKNLPTQLLDKKAGVFVSLKKDNQLRGCIGTIEPTQASVAEEIIRNSIQSATSDPRFSPVQEEELDDLVYSVDILEEPEEIPDTSHLDPSKYGVIVESGGHRGLLLPNLKGVDTVENQVSIVKQKAGIAPGEPVKLYRFQVKRYH